MFIENWDKRGKIKCFESETLQLGDRPKVWNVLLYVPRIKMRRIVEVFRLEGEVSGIMQNAQAICVDQLFEGSRISLAAAEQRSLRLWMLRPQTRTHELLVDERPNGAEQAAASRRTGLQCAQVIQEVAQNLIHELLGQVLPSSAGEFPGDLIDPSLCIYRPQLPPQTRCRSWHWNVSTVDRVDGR